MKHISVNEITRNIKEMCIEANHFLSNDMKIIACAKEFTLNHPDDEFIFVTDDLICRHIASMFFETEKSAKMENEYYGYSEVYLTKEQMCEFYSNLDKNIYGLYDNEYLLIYDNDTYECVDVRLWTGDQYVYIDSNHIPLNGLEKLLPTIVIFIKN